MAKRLPEYAFLQVAKGSAPSFETLDAEELVASFPWPQAMVADYLAADDGRLQAFLLPLCCLEARGQLLMELGGGQLA
ncbi:unnamed protein product, partial [marine sediment metagenome]